MNWLVDGTNADAYIVLYLNILDHGIYDHFCAMDEQTDRIR